MNISRSNVSRSARHIKSVAALLAVTVLAASSWLVLQSGCPAGGEWHMGSPPERSARFRAAPPRWRCRTGACSWRAAPSHGALSSGVATYDPASGAWASGGNLAVARSGHAAALLKDGRVLIAGGTASDGPSFDIEIYDPATGASVHAGDMTLARVDHAAATLKDGRVLIVGGSDGQSPLNLAEIFDPATGQSAGVAASCPPPASRPPPRRCSTGTCWWRAATTARTISRRPKSSTPHPVRSSRPARCRPRAAVTSRCCCRTTTRC